MYIVRKKHVCKQINQNFYFKFSDMLISIICVCLPWYNRICINDKNKDMEKGNCVDYIYVVQGKRIKEIL